MGDTVRSTILPSGWLRLADNCVELAQLTDKIHQRVTSICAARAREQPYACVPESVLVPANLCPLLTERHLVSTDTLDANPAWAGDAHCPREPASASHKLRRCQFVSCRYGAPYEACDPVPKLKKLMALVRRQYPRCKSGQMERRPESVAGSRKMMLCCCGVEPSIETTEKNFEVGHEEVG